MKKLLLVLALCFAFIGSAFAAVDLNTATQAELESVKGIGPAKAKAIIDYRTKNGPFKSVDELDNVKGFGEKMVDKVRSEVTVGGRASAKATSKPMEKAAEKAKPVEKAADKSADKPKATDKSADKAKPADQAKPVEKTLDKGAADKGIADEKAAKKAKKADKKKAGKDDADKKKTDKTEAGKK